LSFQFSLWDSKSCHTSNCATQYSLSILFMRFTRIGTKSANLANLAFNSLYEIPVFGVAPVDSIIYVLSILFMRFVSASYPNILLIFDFQFSLWDSYKTHSFKTYLIPYPFQFSLWDSLVLLIDQQHKPLPFNSLYEIRSIFLLLMVVQKISFNSLYEILILAFVLLLYAIWTFNSLYEIQSETTDQQPVMDEIDFQFSLWDSLC